MTNIVQVDQFITPWEELYKSTAQAFGATYEWNSADVAPISKAAEHIYDALNTGYSLSAEQAEEAINQADFMILLMFAPARYSHTNDNNSLVGVIVPEEFWASYPGRCISKIYDIALPKDKYVNLSTAASVIGVNVAALYRLSEKMKLPFLKDFNETNPKRRKKCRLDLLANIEDANSFINAI